MKLSIPCEARWIPLLEGLVQKFCESYEFPAPLIANITQSTLETFEYLVAHVTESPFQSEIQLGLSLQDQAVVVEVTYDQSLTMELEKSDLDHSPDPDLTQPAESELNRKTIWLDLVKARMDRIFLRVEGKQRTICMMKYWRSEKQMKRFWLMGLAPALAPEVILDIHHDDDGEPVTGLLHNMTSRQVLKLDQSTTFIVQRLDGKHEFYDIYLEYIDRFGLVSPERMSQIFLSLEKAGMLAGGGNQEISPAQSPAWWRWLKKVLRPVHSIPQADQMMSWLHRRLSFLFHPVVALVLLGFGLSGFIPLLEELQAPHEALLKLSLMVYHNTWHLVTLYFFVLVMTAIHELAHGLTCKHFGGSVPRTGVMFLSGMFVFFCDTTSSWILPQKSKKIMVALAGPFVNLLCMSFCFWMWHFSGRYAQPGNSFWFVCGFAAFFILFINLIPLIKFDGYYVLTDLAGLPNLREEAFRYLGDSFVGLFGWRSGGEKTAKLSRYKKVIYLSYGISAVLFTILCVLLPFYRFVGELMT